jgi:hypothetical protein
METKHVVTSIRLIILSITSIFWLIRLMGSYSVLINSVLLYVYACLASISPTYLYCFIRFLAYFLILKKIKRGL